MRKFSLLFFILFVVFFSGNSDTTTLIYSGCSDVKYSSSTPYQYNLNSLLSSLSNSAAFSLYANFTASVASPLYPVYGLYQCRGDLSISDCESCVNSAISQASSLCLSSAGAAVQLQGCLVQYGNDSFVGKPDKSLRLKSCGPGSNTGGYDPNLMAMRDDVLAALLSESGSYRVSQAGNLNGMAQCVGDQDTKHSTDCLNEAVTNLKNLCVGAVSGEVYLGKCYAEFSSKGVQYPYNNNSPSPGNGHGSEAGKDLAIIIGVVAALLLMILFVNYLKKESSEEKCTSHF